MTEADFTQSDGQRDVLWIQRNEPFLWKNYPGKWIAVQNQQLISVGDSVSEVRSEAKRKGFLNPLVTGVRRLEYQNVKLIRQL
jgi:hypothetical protein